MANWKAIAGALQGFGAGVQGNGPQYLQGIQQQKYFDEQMQRQRQEQRSQDNEQVKRKMAQEFMVAYQNLSSGNPAMAAEALRNISNTPLIGSSPAGKIAASALNDLSMNAAPVAAKKLESVVMDVRARYPDLLGKPYEPKSDIGRLTSDYRQGLVPPEAYESTLSGNGPNGHNRASAISRAYDNGTTLKVLPDGSTEVTDPSGRVVSGDERINVLRTARNEQVEFARNRAEASGYGEGASDRVNSTITNGLDVAASAATLRRGIELLQEVETGGWQSVGIRAKQLFGVEGADEGELSANLGRAILSQLRPIFGAQFTEREGDRLARIEAGLGRSTETNSRLIKQLLAIVERDANRAIDAAISIRDFRTADEIQELLNFRLTEEGGNQSQDQQAWTEENQRELDELREWARGR